jgi:CBS domain containing-hemolysin-like protein
VPADIAVPILAALLLAGSFLLSVACYSLRNFTRSRLAAMARARGNHARFGDILKQDETALIACELWLAGCFTAGVSLLILWRGRPATPAGWTLAAEVLACSGAAVLLLMVLPWSISRVSGEAVIFRGWPAIALLTALARPLFVVARRADTLLHRIAGRRDPEPESVETFTDEIQSVVDEGEREGLLESRAGRMIQRIMELREYDVRAVMTPRTDMATVSRNATLEQARQAILECGHSRLPVVGDSPDDVQGILYARDLLEHVAPQGRPVRLPDILRHPHFVPETTTVDHLLERMKRERFHIAVVLDEYGGVTGLVTMEDILEEIVGDIEDEFDDARQEQIQRIDDNTTEVDARMRIDDLNDLLDFALPDDADFDTVGGFVFSELGRVPEQGETFTWRNLRFSVLEADRRRIVKLRIQIDRTLVPAAEEGA